MHKILSPAAFAVLALAVACDTSTSGTDSSLTSLTLQVDTGERDATGNILVVGDTGRGQISGESNDCGLSHGPCPARGGEVSLDASGHQVKIVNHSASMPGSFILVGSIPGQVHLTANADGLKSRDSLLVVAAPLPVDSLWVRSPGTAYDSIIDVVKDASGNVQSITLPLHGSILLNATSFRYGDTVTLPVSIGSASSTVAWASLGCRAPMVDPDCGVFGMSWITGLAPGTTTVTVTARNQQRSILVTVQ